MIVKEIILSKFFVVFVFEFLFVEDEFYLYSGYVGVCLEGEIYFCVVVVFYNFVGLSCVECYRLVSGVFKEEFVGFVYVLVFKIKSLEEYVKFIVKWCCSLILYFCDCICYCWYVFCVGWCDLNCCYLVFKLL